MPLLALPSAARSGGVFSRLHKAKASPRRATSGAATSSVRAPRFAGSFLLAGPVPRRRRLRGLARRRARRVPGENGSIKEVVARAFGLGITTVEVSGVSRLSPVEVVAAAGRRRAQLPALCRCRKLARAAEGKSDDRGSERAQALSPFARDLRHGAAALRALAEGRRGVSRRRRRHADRCAAR